MLVFSFFSCHSFDTRVNSIENSDSHSLESIYESNSLVVKFNSIHFGTVGLNIDFCNNAALYLSDTNKEGKV